MYSQRMGLLWGGRRAVRTPDPQSREPGFESSCCRFETLAISFTPRCHSSLSCINEYMATKWDGHVNVVITWRMNATQRRNFE